MVNRLKDENKRINDVLINTTSAIINQQQGLGKINKIKLNYMILLFFNKKSLNKKN